MTQGHPFALGAGLGVGSPRAMAHHPGDALGRGTVLRPPRILGFSANFVIVAHTVYGLVYFQVISGLTPLQAALFLLPTVTPQLFIARWAGHLADTIGPILPITMGMSAVAVALVWLFCNSHSAWAPSRFGP